MRRRIQEGTGNIGTDRVVRHRIGKLIPGENAQNHHRQHRANGTQGHKAEGILTAAAVAQNIGDTNAQSHNKGHRNGACGNAAGIKGHRQECAVSVDHQHQRKAEQQHIKQHENMGKGHPEHDFQDCQNQKRPHTHADTGNQHRAVHHRAHLIGQNLQVRLRNGNQHSQQKADAAQQPQLPLPGKSGTHMGSHGGHGQIRAHAEKADAQN